MNTNKKNGNDFEREVCLAFKEHKYWVHNFANNKNGQPADLIACNDKFTFLIDAKVCSRDYFDIARIEDNQHSAMTMWMERTGTVPYFVIKFKSGKIYMVSYLNLCMLGEKTSRIKEVDIAKYSITLEDFLNES